MLPIIDAQEPPDFQDRRGNGTLDAIGRLKPGASVERASSEAALLARALQQEHPATNDRQGLLVRRELEARAEETRGVIGLIAMLMGLAVAVLLVACANVAGLLTSLPVLCFGLLAPIAPRLARRWGLERLMVAALLVLTAGIALRLVDALAVILVGSVLVGTAIAVGNVSLPTLVKRDFPHRTGAMTGAYSMVLTGGGALAAAVTVPLIGASSCRVVPASSSLSCWPPSSPPCWCHRRRRAPQPSATWRRSVRSRQRPRTCASSRCRTART